MKTTLSSYQKLKLRIVQLEKDKEDILCDVHSIIQSPYDRNTQEVIKRYQHQYDLAKAVWSGGREGVNKGIIDAMTKTK